MPDLIIRNIDNTVMTALGARAKQHGCSMEEAACRILVQGLSLAPAARPQDAPARLPFGQELRQQLAGLGSLDIPQRNPVRLARRAGASQADL